MSSNLSVLTVWVLPTRTSWVPISVVMEFTTLHSMVKIRSSLPLFTGISSVPSAVSTVAVWVRPHVSPVKAASGQADRGIVTDDTGLTTLPDVYAAGDCCESVDLTTGERRVLALLPNAYLQGECAGKNMAGLPARFDQAVAMNAMGLFGLHLITAGSCRGEALVQEDGGAYKAFFVEDGLLKGYILVGDCLENAGVYTALIRERTPLSTVDFGLLRERPQFLAFSREKRREMFA